MIIASRARVAEVIAKVTAAVSEGEADAVVTAAEAVAEADSEVAATEARAPTGDLGRDAMIRCSVSG